MNVALGNKGSIELTGDRPAGRGFDAVPTVGGTRIGSGCREQVKN